MKLLSSYARTVIIPEFIIFSLVISIFIIPELQGRPPVRPADDSTHKTSYPYISGDTFRKFADYVFDETNNQPPKAVLEYGAKVFTRADLLDKFFKDIHPFLINPYILITHNDDVGIPGKYDQQAYDPKIIRWFGQNVEKKHPKVTAIPIGFANSYWPHGNVSHMTQILQKRSINGDIFGDPQERDIVLCMNFASYTAAYYRTEVEKYFAAKSFCTTIKPNKPHQEYLADLTRSKFVLSPRGCGLDCHRTWEALLLGAVPVMIHSASDSLYDDLPVLLISSWSEITPEFLEKKYQEIITKKYKTEKLYAQYWFDLIDSYRK